MNNIENKKTTGSEKIIYQMSQNTLSTLISCL